MADKHPWPWRSHFAGHGDERYDFAKVPGTAMEYRVYGRPSAARFEMLDDGKAHALGTKATINWLEAHVFCERHYADWLNERKAAAASPASAPTPPAPVTAEPLPQVVPVGEDDILEMAPAPGRSRSRSRRK